MDGNYYVTSILEDCEWKVISTIDQNEFAKTADIPYAIAVSAVIFLALILLFVFLFPLLIKISKQITRLDGAIKEMSGGNLDATVELHGVQELENISNGFNIMVSNTKKYMDTSIESLKEQQKLQFELLLAKINPHFIYNLKILSASPALLFISCRTAYTWGKTACLKKSQMRLRSLTNILSFKTIGIWEDFLFPADGTNPWREPTFPKISYSQ